MKNDTLLFLHGALGTGRQLMQLAGALDHQPCLHFEFPGHGQSEDHESDWSMDFFVESLVRKCDGIDQPLTAIGYSMGGYVALAAGLRYPSIFSRIITIGTKLEWSPEIAAKECAKLDPDKILSKVPAFATMLQQLHGHEKWKKVLVKTAAFMRSLGDSPFLTVEKMRNFQNPVLYCVGDHDEMVSIDETISFFRNTPGADLLIMPDTRHAIEKVDNSLLASHIASFIRE